MMSEPQFMRYVMSVALFILAFLAYIYLQGMVFMVMFSSPCVGGENEPIPLVVYKATEIGLVVFLSLIVANLVALRLFLRSPEHFQAIIWLSIAVNLLIVLVELSDIDWAMEIGRLNFLFTNSFPAEDMVWALPRLTARSVGGVAVVGLIWTIFATFWRGRASRLLQRAEASAHSRRWQFLPAGTKSERARI